MNEPKGRQWPADHPGPAWIVAPDTGIVLEASDAAVAWLETTRDALVGRQWIAPSEWRVDEETGAARAHVCVPTTGTALYPVVAGPMPWRTGLAWLVTLAAPRRVDPTSLVEGRRADHLPGALFRYAVRPDGTDAVSEMSRKCFDLWELEPDVVELDATPLWAQVVPEDLEAMRASVQRSAETLTPWLHEWRNVTPSGKQKWLEGSGVPQRLADGTVVWETFVLDVTARKEAEKAMAELEQRLQDANGLEQLGRLAAGVANDHHNLLTVVLGCSSQARRMLPDTSPVAELLEDVLVATRRAVDLNHALTRFGDRRQAGAMALDVGPRTRTLVPILKALLGPYIVLDVDVPEGLHLAGLAPTAFDRVLMNLASHARDRLSNGGVLELRFAADAHGGVQLRGAMRATGNRPGGETFTECPEGCSEPPGSLRAAQALRLEAIRRAVEDGRARLTLEGTDGAANESRVEVHWPPPPTPGASSTQG